MTEQLPKPLKASPRDAVTRTGEIMSPPVGVFRGEMTVAETIEQLRELTRAAFITYGYVTDEAGKLEGVVVMRDMLLATPETKLEEIMLREPFALNRKTPLADALKAALSRHYPVYPVVDDEYRLQGLVRG